MNDPSDDSDNQQHQQYDQHEINPDEFISRVYHQYINGSSSNGMDSLKFYKFCTDAMIIDSTTLQRGDVDIIFTKYKTGRHLSLFDFEKCVHCIADRKNIPMALFIEFISETQAGISPSNSGTAAEYNRFYDDKSLHTGTYKNGGLTVNDTTAASKFWSHEGYHNLNDKSLNERAIRSVFTFSGNSNAISNKQEPQRRYSSPTNSRGRQTSSGSRSTSPQITSKSPVGTENKSNVHLHTPKAGRRYSVGNTNGGSSPSPYDGFRQSVGGLKIRNSPIAPRVEYNINLQDIQDSTLETIQHYYILYSQYTVCGSSINSNTGCMDGSKFRRFLIDHRKVFIDAKVFTRSEVDLLFTKYYDPSLRRLTLKGFVCALQDIASKKQADINALVCKIARIDEVKHAGNHGDPEVIKTRIKIDRRGSKFFDPSMYTGTAKNNLLFTGAGVGGNGFTINDSKPIHSTSRNTTATATAITIGNNSLAFRRLSMVNKKISNEVKKVKKSYADATGSHADSDNCSSAVSSIKPFNGSEYNNYSSNGKSSSSSSYARDRSASLHRYDSKEYNSNASSSTAATSTPGANGVSIQSMYDTYQPIDFVSFQCFCHDLNIVDSDKVTDADVDRVFHYHLPNGTYALDIVSFFSALETLSELKNTSIDHFLALLQYSFSYSTKSTYVTKANTTGNNSNANVSDVDTSAKIMSTSAAAVIFHSAESHIIKEGYLMKKSNNSWIGYQKRWVQLTSNGTLFYYKNQEECNRNGDEPKGSIVLVDCSITQNNNSFEIGKDHRVYVFKCTTASACENWMYNLNSVANHVLTAAAAE